MVYRIPKISSYKLSKQIAIRMKMAKMIFQEQYRIALNHLIATKASLDECEKSGWFSLQAREDYLKEKSDFIKNFR
jgi:hypothetical protein